jgi:hypothetical protein
MVTHLGLIFENGNLPAFAAPLRGSHYLRPVNGRRAYGYLIAVGNKQHSIQVNRAPFRRIQAFDIYSLTRGYLILFAAGFNNSVNFFTP